MKKLLSMIVASSLALSSTAMLASATENAFGIESNSTVGAGLDLKIKGTSGLYGDYADEANALNIAVSQVNPESGVSVQAKLDMSAVAEKWNEYVQAGTDALVNGAGLSEEAARAAVLANVSLADSTFTLKVTTDSAVTNGLGDNVLTWSTVARSLFEQDGEIVVTEESGAEVVEPSASPSVEPSGEPVVEPSIEPQSGEIANTESDKNVYTVNMKVKATNAELDRYFNSDTLGEISVVINDSKVTGIGGPYSIKAEFDGNILIDVPGDENDMTIALDEEDTCYVMLSKRTSNGGGGGVVKPTATPTVKPTETPSTEPTETPSTEPTEAPSVEPQKGGTANGAKLNYEEKFAYIQGYDEEDGSSSVRPENNITRAEVAMIFYRLLTAESREKFESNENSFTDVNVEDWFNTAISTATAAGIINGYDDGTVRPNNAITRAEFAAIVSRFTSLVYEGDNKFNDTDSHWAKDSINNVAMTGWINGYEDGSFGPEKNITRAEAVTIINRLLYRTIAPAENTSKWNDNTNSMWYYNDMEAASGTDNYTTSE